MTVTALQRLLKYPHNAVFDKSPVSELAFRLQHPLGAKWAIADRVLTATGGTVAHTYDLTAYTVDTLAAALTSDGFDIVSRASRFTGVSALVLVEGDGDQFDSNGDHVHAFTSLLWVLMSGYAGEVLHAENQVVQALLQMVIGTASGEWLDVWGTLYSVPRLPGELDPAYRLRIPREAFRLRNNAHAIEQAILDATGYDVRINEPWREVFTLDESTLSGPDKFYDGERVGYHLIEPITSGYVDWPAVLAVINRNRAAGIEVLGPRLIYGVHVDGTSGHVVRSSVRSIHVDHTVLDDLARLDTGPLEDLSVLNHPSAHLQQRMYSSHLVMPAQPWGAFPWPPTTWAETRYIVRNLHIRDYRSYLTHVTYVSQYWAVAGRTWNDHAADTWDGMNPIIRTLHTRS